MKEISVLLPSLRPEALARTIREFDKTNSDVDYEIVAVSPFQVSGIKTVWIKEESPRGGVFAQNIAYINSKGEYKIYFSDDVSPTVGCLRNLLNFMKVNTSPFIGAFKMITPTGREIGPFGAYKRLYACYGCVNDETVKQLGSFLDDRYEYSWADIDISLRCWLAGGRVEICKDALVIPRQIEDELYKSHRGVSWDRDVEAFLSRWHLMYGNGIERKHDAVNRRLE